MHDVMENRPYASQDALALNALLGKSVKKAQGTALIPAQMSQNAEPD